ncbi:MAG: helix-turn-helix transcriptional regulator [Clostridia bacterium]|nr:helix-turn-helix transcriptional regulator [Clostridia bacterium]
MFWKNFRELCDGRKLSPNAVAKALRLSSGSVTAWKNGVMPRATALRKIADYFGVSVADLIEEKKPAENIPILRGVDKLNADQLKIVQKIIDSLIDP